MQDYPGLDGSILLLTLLMTALIAVLLLVVNRKNGLQVMVLFFVAGFFIYSGVGLAYDDLASHYLLPYLGVLLFAGLYLAFFDRLFCGVEEAGNTIFGWFFEHRLDRAVIVMYLLVILGPLLIPEWRLERLIMPPALDLKSQFEAQFHAQPPNALLEALKYLKYLLTPWYLIALGRDGLRPLARVFLILFPLWIDFTVDGYVGRGPVCVALIIILYGAWCHGRAWRRWIMAAAILAAPLAIWLLDQYTVLRLGHEWKPTSVAESIVTTVQIETSLPLSGAKMVRSGRSLPLHEYFFWIATLPVPKAAFGDLQIIRLNHFFSEIILEIKEGDPGFYVLLPGYSLESVFLFGRSLSVLNPLIPCALAAFLMRFTRSTKETIYFVAYVLLTMGYTLNRGGAGAALPILVNQCFSVYAVYLVWLILSAEKGRAGATAVVPDLTRAT